MLTKTLKQNFSHLKTEEIKTTETTYMKFQVKKEEKNKKTISKQYITYRA